MLSNHLIIEYQGRGPQDSFAAALPRQCSPHLYYSSSKKSHPQACNPVQIQSRDSKEKCSCHLYLMFIWIIVPSSKKLTQPSYLWHQNSVICPTHIFSLSLVTLEKSLPYPWIPFDGKRHPFSFSQWKEILMDLRYLWQPRLTYSLWLSEHINQTRWRS